MTDREQQGKPEPKSPDTIENEELTGEVGSEGGSPGNITRRRPQNKPLRGGESAETAKRER